MRVVIEEWTPVPGARIIAVSDVHGALSYLRGLLDRVSLTPADQLVLLGDIVEKGPDSLATLRYVMALSKKYRVRLVSGNCDRWDRELDEPTPRTDEFIRRYMCSERGQNGLLCQMCGEIGFPVSADMDMEALRSALRGAFAPELDYFRAAPHILETPCCTFVHGGLLPGAPESWDPWSVMKNDYYLSHPIPNGKWQVTGHTPVVLYRDAIADASPIIDRDRRMIAIDGGCMLKDDGQLNALIIPFEGSSDFLTAYYDPFPVRRVKTAQAASRTSAYIRWGDNRVEIIERGGEFCRCRHVPSGYEMDILTSYLEGDGPVYRANDCTDYALPLQSGDQVSVVETTSRGYLCKRRGVSGWYFGELL